MTFACHYSSPTLLTCRPGSFPSNFGRKSLKLRGIPLCSFSSTIPCSFQPTQTKSQVNIYNLNLNLRGFIRPSFKAMQEAQIGWMFDVFVSFRAEDTGKNFTDHLCTALDQKGIVTFRYDQAIERGKSISSEVPKSIRESRFSIVVFSRSYACSNRCLDELVQILACMKSTGQIVFPVFYYVDPSDVRKQTGCFEKAFCEHEQNFTGKVKSWRAAMKEAANLSGWDLTNK